MPVQYFSVEQRYWLDNQIDMYKYCDEHNDLVDFWTSLFEIFFTCWPEHEVLFPDGPAPQDFTEEQRQAVVKAVVTRKCVSTSLTFALQQADHSIIIAPSELVP